MAAGAGCWGEEALKWGGKAARKREAEQATTYAEEFLKNPPKPRPEGKGTCKLCKTKNGHAGWCPRIS